MILISVTPFQCSLTEIPEFNKYKFQNGTKLSIQLEAYRMNASLAVQLSHAWMRKVRKNSNDGTKQMICNITSNAQKDKDGLLVDMLCKETVIGLKETKWPGRYQVIKTDYATFFLDGAHTKESMAICVKWFKDNNR